MNKFKYILFPDNTYSITFKDSEGQNVSVEIKGTEIINQIKKMYALDKNLNLLDSDDEQ
jgi:hypothetical protein